MCASAATGNPLARFSRAFRRITRFNLSTHTHVYAMCLPPLHSIHQSCFLVSQMRAATTGLTMACALAIPYLRTSSLIAPALPSQAFLRTSLSTRQPCTWKWGGGTRKKVNSRAFPFLCTGSFLFPLLRCRTLTSNNITELPARVFETLSTLHTL